MQVDRTRLYRVGTVAELIDVSKSTVYRAIDSGALDVLRIGKTLRVPGTALARWLEACGHVDASVSRASTRDVVDAADVIAQAVTR